MVPVAHHHFDLSANEFQDALALHYHKALLRMPESYDECGGPFMACHALDCQKGGLVMQCHNEVGDALGNFAAMANSEVIRGPAVRESQKIKRYFSIGGRSRSARSMASSDID